MPRPTRKKPTLRKIAERGFAFSGTTREHGQIFERPQHNIFIAYRHGFVVTKDILKALISTFGKKHTTKEGRDSFRTSLNFSSSYSKRNIDIKNGELIYTFEKTPVILYTYDYHNMFGGTGLAEAIRKKHRSQMPYDEPIHSRAPFRYFEITPDLVRSGFEVWKKRYNPTEDRIHLEIEWRKRNKWPSDLESIQTSDFILFLDDYLYKKFIVHIIREYKQEISKRRVQK
ncbi:MAG: hypothetical protein PHH82_00640 [Candidatus ainarchaeum sp.]|nr:hypothetical protein [Candidatus ainarchaeum sp.]